ncbi:radical SAM protein [Sporomusa aerivorans]|uniref:radical SAM protein n=1 Tax=Sporomusa aerivorans TaxID=204936 RepID=UPI00352B8DC7
MDKQISQIISKAVEGGEITAPELQKLLSVHYLSEEAYLIQWAARKLSAAAAKGKAEVHAQVGINVGPCSKNCHFCSFAPINKVFPKEQVFSRAEIIEKALRFEADGANAIYLMVTANYKMADYLEIARDVRAALKPDTPMVANVDDFDEAGASALKTAGFAGIYHVIRMGEGVVTGIDPKVRLKTVAAAQKAGLLVGTCVEPVGPEHSIAEIVEKTMLAKAMKPVHAGSGRRINIPGSPLEVHGAFTEAQQAPITAAVKLAMGYDIPGHAGGDSSHFAMAGVNLSWAESGSNPRDTKANTVIGGTVDSRRQAFEQAGWEIVEGPSRLFGGR